MFCDCKNITKIDLFFFDYKNIIDMESMFDTCTSLKFLPDISKWVTKNVTNMGSMFSYCSSLKSLPDFYMLK